MKSILLIYVCGMVFLCYHYLIVHAIGYIGNGGLKFRPCLQTASAIVLKRTGLSLRRCFDECKLHYGCIAVNYWKIIHVCEIFYGHHGNVVVKRRRPCIHVMRHDILGASLPHDICGNCTIGEVCNQTTGACAVQECPLLTVPNGVVLGNMYTVGSKRKLVCLYGSEDGVDVSYPVCQPDGSWSDMINCSMPECSLPPNITNAELNLNGTHDGANATYTCMTSFVVAVNGHRSMETTRNITCNGPNQRWLNDDFECVPVCPPSSNAVNLTVGNLSLVLFTTAFNHRDAKICCKEVGALVRIDSADKMATVQSQILGVPVFNLDFWVQGKYRYSNKYEFDDGTVMPTDSALVHDLDGSKKCVLLEDSVGYLFNDKRCTFATGFICEVQ